MGTPVAHAASSTRNSLATSPRLDQLGPMPNTLAARLISWADELDPGTLEQAGRTARLEILAGPVALMPDAHVGIGATIGSVVATAGAVVPAAVGVDLGCGMIAARTDLSAGDLPDDLTRLRDRLARAVPAGVGRGHDDATDAASSWLAEHPPPSELSGRQAAKAADQFGSLGSGNHFVEVSLDRHARVWVVLHSGSRGIGNELASRHIATAKALAKAIGTELEDPDLAWFTQGTDEFAAYVADMHWAQDYAAANREQLLEATLAELWQATRPGVVVERVNCHHNFCAEEVHGGRPVWVTRKGAIRARAGERGVIPGSMGTSTFVVRGKGNPASYESCAHGAGRRLSRGQARKQLSVERLRDAMAGRTWQEREAEALLDESPEAYKDIHAVMAAQADLVEVEEVLTQVLNYKGTR